MFSTRGIGGLALVGIAVPVMALMYRDGPPLGHTGGFGEPTCYACHFDGPLDSREAIVNLSGTPEGYVPDSTYSLSIGVWREELGAGGFSISGRFRDGSQAGQFVAIDDRVAVRLDSNAVQYAMHTFAGSRGASADSLAWNLRWLAPASSDTVFFNLAGNAGNGDDSPFGDLVKAVTIQVPSTAP